MHIIKCRPQKVTRATRVYSNMGKRQAHKLGSIVGKTIMKGVGLINKLTSSIITMIPCRHKVIARKMEVM